MGNLFGSKSPRPASSGTTKQPSRVTEADKAVLQLKQQRDKLKQYKKKLTLNLEKERLLAKSFLNEGKKDKALLLLRKKKYQEGIISKTESQLDNIDQLVQDLEFAQIESQVLQGLKTGNESLKSLQKLMLIEDVEKIMDETQEAVDYQRQISDLLSGGLTDDDESEVLDELNELLAAESDANLELPEAPADKLTETGEKAAAQQSRTKKQAVLAS